MPSLPTLKHLYRTTAAVGMFTLEELKHNFIRTVQKTEDWWMLRKQKHRLYLALRKEELSPTASAPET